MRGGKKFAFPAGKAARLFLSLYIFPCGSVNPGRFAAEGWFFPGRCATMVEKSAREVEYDRN